MKYISGIPALNILCSLETPGDWHAPSVNWESLDLYESEEMFFNNYEIEKTKQSRKISKNIMLQIT